MTQVRGDDELDIAWIFDYTNACLTLGINVRRFATAYGDAEYPASEDSKALRMVSGENFGAVFWEDHLARGEMVSIVNAVKVIELGPIRAAEEAALKRLEQYAKLGSDFEIIMPTSYLLPKRTRVVPVGDVWLW